MYLTSCVSNNSTATPQQGKHTQFVLYAMWCLNLEINPMLAPQILPVSFESSLDPNGSETGPLGVILVGDRGAKEGHHSIAGELVDRTFIPVDFIHQDKHPSII